MSGKRNNKVPPSPDALKDGISNWGKNTTSTSASQSQHIQNSFLKASAPSHANEKESNDGFSYSKVGMQLIGGLKKNSKHPFATGFNHINTNQDSENFQHNNFNSTISNLLSTRVEANKAQSKPTKSFITSHLNDSIAGLLKTGILVEDNDICQSTEHSNPDLTAASNINTKFMFGPNTFSDHDQNRSNFVRNKQVGQFFDHHNDDDTGTSTPSALATAEEDLSQVTSQLKLIQQTQDTLLASLKDDIEVVQTENLVLQQSNSRLQNQVSHLTQLVADLTFDLHQMRDIVKSSPLIGVNIPLSSKESFTNDPTSPPSIGSSCNFKEEIPNQYSSFMHMDVSSSSQNRKQMNDPSLNKEFGNGNQYGGKERKNHSSSSRNKLNNDKSRRSKERVKRNDKSSPYVPKQKSRRNYEKAKLRNQNCDYENENEENFNRNRSATRQKQRQAQDKSEEGTGCFGFFKSNKKKKIQRDLRRDRDSSTRESSRSKIQNNDYYY